ncbi:MAG TPA: 50S ribosomal protein L25 [Acidimicrobiia bacterium]|jgi:large subunit ribosomal protein L25|nr:50S ribosomal protein L25 [Acidimicrobiia bacterium]
MDQVTLRARAGRKPGSRESRRIRRQGQVPAIVYGPDVTPIPVAVDAHDLHLALHTEAGSNAIINLEIEGGDTLTTMAKIIERHPFRNEYRHIDFVTVDLTKKVHAEVALHFEGTPIGVREGGVFSPNRTHVLIEVLPTEIPAFIELDVSEVEIGGSLRIEDLPELEGIVYLEESDAVVMSVTLPAAEIEEPEAEEGEAAEGEEPVEGEEPEEGAEEPAGEGEATEDTE